MTDTCFYKHSGDINITVAECCDKPFVPQMDMNFCPFCGNALKILRLATNNELDDLQLPQTD